MNCPSDNRLKDLCLGKIQPSQEVALHEHIEVCDSCQHTIERLANTNPQELALLLESKTDHSCVLVERLEYLKQARPDRPEENSAPKSTPTSEFVSRYQSRIFSVSLLFFVASFATTAFVFFNTILSRDVRTATSEQELIQHLKSTQDLPLVIEVQSNKVYTLEAFSLGGQDVEIRATGNDKAKLVFPIKQDQIAIDITNGRMKLCKLQIEYSAGGNEPTDDPEAIISCKNGKLSLDHCTIMSSDRFCIESINSNVSVRHSNLISEIESIICQSNESTELVISSSNVNAECAVSFRASTTGSVSIENSILSTDFAIDIPFQKQPARPFIIHANNSEFVCDTATISVSQTSLQSIENAELPPQLFDWVGNHNRITNKTIILTHDGNETYAKIPKTEW